MMIKHCRMCKHAKFSLDFQSKVFVCSSCTKHVEMAQSQLTKYIKYFKHLNMDEIASELGISKAVLNLLEETGQLHAIQSQMQRSGCKRCQRQLQAQEQEVCTKCLQQATPKKPTTTNRSVQDRRRQHQLKQQIISALSSSPNHARYLNG